MVASRRSEKSQRWGSKIGQKKPHSQCGALQGSAIKAKDKHSHVERNGLDRGARLSL